LLFYFLIAKIQQNSLFFPSILILYISTKIAAIPKYNKLTILVCSAT